MVPEIKDSPRDLYLSDPRPWLVGFGGGRCPLVVDQSTPNCGNSRFGCWTFTVVERPKASEGLLASDEQWKERPIEFATDSFLQSSKHQPQSHAHAD